MAKTNEDRALPLACRNFPSPVGQLRLVASDAGLRAVLWEREPAGRVRLPEAAARPDHPILVQTARELTEYFRRERQHFTIALDMEGTPFQLSVWQYLAAIPFGETRTYVDVARDLGQPGAARAVGAANGRNPVSIVVPCHRVVGASGKLTGFVGGLNAKAYLLRLEQPPNLFPVEAVA